MITYLLPCSCGQKITVEARQAGEIIFCRCGRSLEVPTLLKLRALERVEVPQPAEMPKKSWNAGHRLILLGAVVIFAAIAIGGWLFWIHPTDPYANLNPEQIKLASQIISPQQSWRLWLMLEQGGLERHRRGLEIAFTDQLAQHKIYWSLLAVVVGAGLAVVAAGILIVNYRDKISWLTRKRPEIRG